MQTDRNKQGKVCYLQKIQVCPCHSWPRELLKGEDAIVTLSRTSLQYGTRHVMSVQELLVFPSSFPKQIRNTQAHLEQRCDAGGQILACSTFI